MSSAPTYGSSSSSQNYAYAGNNANNKQAQLGNAYQELAKELSSEKLKVVGGYTLGRVIGEGTYGSVHLATHRATGTRCAVKKIPKAFSPHLTREIHHHRRLHHPFIVHLHEVVATETHIWLVTELCSGGELFDYLAERGRILEGEARKLFGELTVAVGVMHRQGVVHRDLKLENVLLDGELHIKLGDLGFAREWQKGRLMETYCGTTGYASPEMLAGRKYLGIETDVWSLGIILYTLLAGGLPFDDDNEGVMKDLILKGEYEEPEWLTEDARSLIRSMLQIEPSKRPSIEGILTHPWFKSTIIDKMPEEHPTSPGLTPHFDEPFSSKMTTPHKIPSRGASPLHFETQPPIYEESDQSETSQQDSEFGKADTDSTTPTTAESGDVGEVDDIKRVHSGEFSQTEKDLEMLHSNTSQSTIRRGSDSPNLSSGHGSGVKSRVAVKSGLEGHKETDEEDTSSMLDTPLAHSRTPSRTKRRSVSSTLSLERRHSHHSSHWTTWSPEDWMAKLNEIRPEPFSTPSEKYLMNQLTEIGFNIGQITHSVTNNACDSSAAAWWMLRAKQAERGETDEVISARMAAQERKNERAAAYARDERKRHREKSTDRPVNVSFIDQPSFTRTPSSPTVDLGSPQRSTVPLSGSPGLMTPGETPSVSIPTPNLLHPHSSATEFPLRPHIDSTRSFDTKAPPAANVVDPATVESSPSKERDKERPLKGRSPSMSMLQRATSALVSGSWKNDDKNEKAIADDTVTDGSGKDKEDKRSISPTKLTKPPPRSKMVKSESEHSIQSIESGRSGNTIGAGPSRRMSTPLLAPVVKVQENVAGPSTYASAASDAASPTNKDVSAPNSASKTSKRDAFWSWNSWRYMFNDGRRRRSRDEPGKEHKPGPALVLSRGISGRGPHVNRVVQPIRRSSSDGRPVYSRRSSSVNSRRSSFNSGMVHTSSHDALPTLALGRRTSARSHGSQTPTSEREFNPLSRPTSLHERDSHLRPHSRRSSQNLRSPSMQSDSSAKGFRYSTPASPLHNYQRRAPKGTDSRRVRHIRVIPEGQVMIRSESVASSIRSNASSRASSRERIPRGDRDDSDYDTGREDSSIQSRNRNRSRPDLGSLAQQIHRKNSPLTLPTYAHSQHRTHSLKPPVAKPKAPLRDVFQGKEEEWVSDDEDIYSGGLGQKGQQHQSSRVGWEPNTRAFPHGHGHGNGRKHGHGHGLSKGQSRSRRGSSDEEESRKTLGQGQPVAEKAPVPVESVAASGRRRGIPSGRGTAPVIEEEEEEEE